MKPKPEATEAHFLAVRRPAIMLRTCCVQDFQSRTELKTEPSRIRRTFSSRADPAKMIGSAKDAESREPFFAKEIAISGWSYHLARSGTPAGAGVLVEQNVRVAKIRSYRTCTEHAICRRRVVVVLTYQSRSVLSVWHSPGGACWFVRRRHMPPRDIDEHDARREIERVWSIRSSSIVYWRCLCPCCLS